VSKIFFFILISLFFTNCSLNKNSKLWNKEDQIVNEVKDQKEIIFVEEKKELTIVPTTATRVMSLTTLRFFTCTSGTFV